MASTSFTVEELSLPGVLLIKPRIFKDERGSSAVSYSEEQFKEMGITTHFVQDYVSVSAKGVVRGLHFQKTPFAQDKLVRCSEGSVLDVVADVDQTSPTFGQHIQIPLAAEQQTMVFIPGKYAHGFCVESDQATVEYKMSCGYKPDVASGVRFDDPILTIKWPCSTPILSDADAAWPFISIKNEK